MDQDFISKFPCGGTWWKVQHPEVQVWQQAFYESAVVNTQSTETFVGKDLLAWAGKDTMEATPTSQNHAPIKEEVPVQRGVNRREPRMKLKNVCEYILEVLDPCASLYTTMQKLDATQWLKQRLFNFVSSDAHLYLGPKKSRILSAWLSGNPCKPDSETIVRDFVMRLVGENHANEQTMQLHMDRRGNWFVKE